MALEFTDDLKKKFLAEKQNVEEALENLRGATDRRDKSVVELAAIATFLHNIYNGIENILIQILKSQDIKIPKSETWHKDLLEVASSNEFISETLSDKLYKYLAFRHFFIHAYGFMLEERKIEPLVKNIPNIWSQFLYEIGMNNNKKS